MNRGKEDHDAIGQCKHPNQETRQGSPNGTENRQINPTDHIAEESHCRSTKQDASRKHASDHATLLLRHPNRHGIIRQRVHPSNISKTNKKPPQNNRNKSPVGKQRDLE